MDSHGGSSKDRISCLRFSLEDAAPKGTAVMDSNQSSVCGVRWVKLLVIFKAKAISVVICIS